MRITVQYQQILKTHDVTDASDIAKTLREVEADHLQIQFLCGRRCLKIMVTAIQKEKENGATVFHGFTLNGDNGGKDYHRDPEQWVSILRQVELSDPTLLCSDWKIKGLISVLAALKNVAKEQVWQGRFPWKALPGYLKAAFK